MTNDRDTDEHGNPLCGEPCKGGGACKNVAVNDDGSCWIPSHGAPNPAEVEDPGRPSKLDRQTQEEVASWLEKGHSMTVAARKAGISRDTCRRWRQRGRAAEEQDEQGPYRDFYARTEEARAEGERRWAERAMEWAIDGESFGAAMEILRKRYPDSWTSRAHDMDDEAHLRVLLSNDESPESAGREYAMTPEDVDE